MNKTRARPSAGGAPVVPIACMKQLVEYKVLLLSPLGLNFNVKFCPPPKFVFRAHFWLGCAYKGPKMVPVEMSTPHSYSTYMNTSHANLAPFGYNKHLGRQTNDRLTDKAISIG